VTDENPPKTRQASPLSKAVRDVEKAKRRVEKLSRAAERYEALYNETKTALVEAENQLQIARQELNGLL
jgi:hypothetical protein